MLAAHITEWCEPGTVYEKIKFGPIAAPGAPTKNQVIVGIKAASINVDDCPLLQDTACGGMGYHTRKPTVAQPVVGGQDFAGVVLECGPDCKKLKVGDRVCGFINLLTPNTAEGTWAERTVIPESDVCLIGDDSISFVDAAAMAMGAFVNFHAIKSATRPLVAGGFRCLVIGASGALGSLMLQLLRKYKGHVTAVCSGKNAEAATKMGANEVIDYTQKSFGEQLAEKEKFQVVFDYVGGKEVQGQAVPLLSKGGLFVTVAGPTIYMSSEKKLTGGEMFNAVCFHLGKSLCGCCSSYKYVMIGSYPPLKQDMWDASRKDGARAFVAEEVPFSEEPIRKALKRVMSHHPGGRVVINMEKNSTTEN